MVSVTLVPNRSNGSAAELRSRKRDLAVKVVGMNTGSNDVSAPDEPSFDDRSLVPAVTRAVAILDLLATESAAMGPNAIARRLGLPKSSVANICATLVDAGLLRPLDSGVTLGPRLAQFGAAYLGSVDQVRLFQESCDLFEAGASDTAQLAMLTDGLGVVYLAKREGLYPVQLASAPGRTLPATCTATGKAMLASLDDDELAERLAQGGPLPRLTPKSVTSIKQLKVELARIRQCGYALDQEEVIEGVVCVAVAIPRRGRTDPLLAISITILKPRATKTLLAKLAEELRVVTDAVAMGLGVPELRRPRAG